MLRRTAATRPPAAPCSRIPSGTCLGCPNCLRTGWMDDGKSGRQPAIWPD
ncbi:hypothetical protein [Hoeflea sp. BAL378]|nr:hypothetical protein [Hoeflea sp. BAL378]